MSDGSLKLPDKRPSCLFKEMERGTVAGDDNIALTRHHIIPYNVLRAFWNQIIDNREQAKCSSFIDDVFDKLPSYYAAKWTTRNREVSELGQLLGSIPTTEVDEVKKAFRTWFVNGTLPEDQKDLKSDIKGESSDVKTVWETAYTWLPGNLFIGPKESLRSDDPGDGFEASAQRIVDGERSLKLAGYKNLFNSMKSYSTGGAASGTLLDLNDMMKELTTIAKYTAPIPVCSKDWTKVGKKYEINPELAPTG